MPITPDVKDWTWVLQRRCEQCSFDAASIQYDSIGAMVRENAQYWLTVLALPGVRARPDDSTWSALEYAAHLRDVHRIMRRRLDLIITQPDPVFANWDHDATAIAERYNEQDPATVGVELVEAAHTAASAFEAVPIEARTRTGRRSDGTAFSVDSLARYYAHEAIHHLHDVRG